MSSPPRYCCIMFLWPNIKKNKTKKEINKNVEKANTNRVEPLAYEWQHLPVNVFNDKTECANGRVIKDRYDSLIDILDNRLSCLNDQTGSFVWLTYKSLYKYILEKYVRLLNFVIRKKKKDREEIKTKELASKWSAKKEKKNDFFTYRRYYL